MSEDAVNHPKHYTQHPSGVECITVTEWMSFNLGNAIKYVWRAGEKGDPIQDLRKAVWYIEREIERLTRERAKDYPAAAAEDAARALEQEAEAIMSEDALREQEDERLNELATKARWEHPTKDLRIVQWASDARSRVVEVRDGDEWRVYEG